MTVARFALALALALGCRARHRPEVASDAPVIVADRVIDAALDAAEDVAVRRGCLAVEYMAGAAWGIAGWRVCKGDTVVTSVASRVMLVGASRFELGALSEARVPARDGVALIVGRGMVAMIAPMMAPEPARVDTPAGRVIVSSGRALVAVADDGSVRVAAEEGAVTVWPSEREAAVVAMDAGDVVTFSVTNARAPVRAVRPLGPWMNAEAARWLAARNAGLRLPAAIDALSRAEAADMALGVGADMMLSLGATPDARERDRIEARRSLALGRAEARAMRLRALRSRGAQRDS